MSLEETEKKHERMREQIERGVREKVEKWRLGIAQEVKRLIEDATESKNENDTAEVRSPAASFSASPIPNVTNGDTSMNEITTPAAQPATISKKELWTFFSGTTIERGLTIGSLECPEAIGGRYMPSDLLNSYGEFNEMEGLSEQVAEIVSDDNDPLWALDTIIDDLEGYAADLKVVRDDFERFSSLLETDGDVPEDEVRYRHPGIASKPAPATLKAVEDAVGALECTGINLSDHPVELLGLVGDDEAVANLRHLADLLDQKEAA